MDYTTENTELQHSTEQARTALEHRKHRTVRKIHPISSVCQYILVSQHLQGSWAVFWTGKAWEPKSRRKALFIFWMKKDSTSLVCHRVKLSSYAQMSKACTAVVDLLPKFLSICLLFYLDVIPYFHFVHMIFSVDIFCVKTRCCRRDKKRLSALSPSFIRFRTTSSSDILSKTA